jgi:hypothetical protein
MISVTFYKSGDTLTGCKISGHSGYAEEGSDIVCAAVSSAAIMTVNTITDILHINADVTASDGLIIFKLSHEDAVKASDLIEGLQLHLNALSEQYKKYIKLKISEV